MPEITLSRGMVALVDEVDLPLLEPFRWCASENKRTNRTVWYALANATLADGRRIMIKMHRLIMGAPVGILIDHINHNGLDNRRENLRPSNQVQNSGNARPRHGYKGVHWNRRLSRWVAKITVDNRARHLGCFADPWEAVQVYNAAAVQNWGEFAYLNTELPLDQLFKAPTPKEK